MWKIYLFCNQESEEFLNIQKIDLQSKITNTLEWLYLPWNPISKHCVIKSENKK